MSTQNAQSTRSERAKFPSPPPPAFVPTDTRRLLASLNCLNPARIGVQPNEFKLTEYEPDEKRDGGIRELAAIMQHVRANRTLRLQYVAYRLSQTWDEGLWQLGDPEPGQFSQVNDQLVQIMSCILGRDQKEQAEALEGLAKTAITPELLAEYDRLIDALEASLSHQEFIAAKDAGPLRARPELLIAFAGIQLREQAENAIDESEHRRVMEVLTYGELAQRLIASPVVARRLGSVSSGANPAHVMRWVFRLDKLPPVSFAGEQAKIAAIGTVFDWVAGLDTADPHRVARTVGDDLVVAGLVLSKT